MRTSCPNTFSAILLLWPAWTPLPVIRRNLKVIMFLCRKFSTTRIRISARAPLPVSWRPKSMTQSPLRVLINNGGLRRPQQSIQARRVPQLSPASNPISQLPHLDLSENHHCSPLSTSMRVPASRAPQNANRRVNPTSQSQHPLPIVANMFATSGESRAVAESYLDEFDEITLGTGKP